MDISLYESKVFDLTCKSLRQCINVHGPITKDMIGSAAKRVVSTLDNAQLINHIQNDTVDARVTELEKKIVFLRKKNRKMGLSHYKLYKLLLKHNIKIEDEVV